ncbi:MAG: ParB/RepB/Spo0J family partition protein [Clostridiaceae bacterium]
MAKKFGLGKGLNALIPDEVEEEKVEKEIKSVNEIDINLIKPNKEQPRKNFDVEKIADLANSIKEHGIIQPVVLKKDDNNTYTIIAGERRWRAARSLSLKTIPAVIMDLDDKSLLEVSLIENIQREDLNPIEEALAYKRLLVEFNLTQEELSKRIAKSRTAITNTIRLINLDERVQEYLIEGVISEGHGRAILSLDDKEKQYEIAQAVIDNNLSVRETEKLIKNLSVASTKETNTIEKKNIYIEDVKYKLENLFGTKVDIKNGKDDKGKIEIKYNSQEDLQRIIELFKV